MPELSTTGAMTDSSSIAYVLKGFPRLSELFIASEILRLEQSGVRLRLFVIKRDEETFQHPIVDRIRARRHYLPATSSVSGAPLWQWLRAHLGRFMPALLRTIRRRPLGVTRAAGAAFAQAIRARRTFFSPLRKVYAKEFLQAVALADQVLIDPSIRHLHAHIANPSFPAPPESALGAAAPAAAWRLAPGLHLPCTLQASAGVERSFGRRAWLAAEYLLLRTHDGLRTRNINEPLAPTGIRPDPARLNVFQIESTEASRTNQLALTFRARLSEFRGTVQYTLSRTLDDASSIFDVPVDGDNLGPERGRADFDRRHRLNVAGTYGWKKDRVRVGGVLAVRSGAPFNIVTGSDDNHDLVANDRPAGITRNTGDGPAFAQLDLRLATVFRAPRPPSADPESARREQTDNLELSLDLFNALNRVNTNTFVGVATSPLFGQGNSARTPRTAQLSLRYRF